MPEIDVLLEKAETFVHKQTGKYFSDLQRIILAEALSDQPKRKTYDQIATETGYSGKYLKQVVAPQLWQLLSDAVGERIQKSNVRGIFIPILQSLQDINGAALASGDPRSSEALSESESESTNPESVDTVAQLSGGANLSQPAVEDASALADLEAEPDVPSIIYSDPSRSQSSVTGEPVDNDEVRIPETKAIILLVDDQPQNLALLSDMLENEGYEVRQAINGALALKVAVNKPPDIILLDVNMPGMDGYEVCRQLKANPITQSIPVIFVSALHETWDKVKAFSVGGSDYMTKPLKVMEVIARIENQLKIQRSQRQLHCLGKQLEYTQRILADLGLLDPTMGIVNRNHFDTLLQRYWQEAIQTRQSLSLILCQIQPAPNPESVDDASSSIEQSIPTSPTPHWPLIVQTMVGAIDHHSPMVAVYEAPSSTVPHQGTIVAVLSRTDLTQRKAIAQSIHAALQPHLKTMTLTIHIGGSSLVPLQADDCKQLIEMAKQSLQPSDSPSSSTNFQAWPL